MWRAEGGWAVGEVFKKVSGREWGCVLGKSAEVWREGGGWAVWVRF